MNRNILIGIVVFTIACMSFDAYSATVGWVSQPAGGASRAKNMINNSGESIYMDIDSTDTGGLPHFVCRNKNGCFVIFDSDITSNTPEGATADVWSMCVTSPTGILADDKKVCDEIGTLQSGVVSDAALTGDAVTGGKQQRGVFYIPSGQEVFMDMTADPITGGNKGRFRAGGH